MKKILLIVIDALTPRVMESAMADGRLPTLQALAETGEFDAACTTIFPSITHAALTSIATGRYPSQSGIPASFWFEEKDNEVVHYIDDLRAILNRGMGEFFQDMLIHMNRERIRVDTIFEIVERAGYKAACINHLVHRGFIEHQVNIPLLGKLVPGTAGIKTVGGPSMLYMGDLVTTPLETDVAPPPAAGLTRRYGLDDRYSAETLLYLARTNMLPALTVTYFMDNDYESHNVGPRNAARVLTDIDDTLAQFCALYGGIEKTLEQFCIIITGDHAQSNISNDEADAAIVLENLLTDFSIAPIGQGWRDEHYLVVCPNMRTAQIYAKDPARATVKRIADRLLDDLRVDQVMWRASRTADASTSDGLGYCVVTKDRGDLRFWPATDAVHGAASAQDAFGCLWHWQGSLEVVDGTITPDGTLDFRHYPNAFERIACALDAPNGGHLWATARQGAEFRLESSPVHTGGGSHASLHALDSHVPLLLAGAPAGIILPSAMRTVDVLPLCLNMLGINSSTKVGMSHVA